ncbi:peptidase C14, caspase domain-containing protein [Mycena albidolilacea]|uniref:Peptidase C14, caspase domain-containing protein n=1 Tax=Mycena albidolilacea TaxID=1033008 RepID=A0AAD6ZFW5_9AGAR|nr:peptidase C14, caspase domain-containing protein [Mycena albidolilacea]
MGKIKALLVGCSYDNQDLEMQAGKHDVKAMAKFMKENFDMKATRVLHEDAPDHRQPTRRNILDGFKWLLSDVDPHKDHLFFYFAGHGGLKHGASHILPVDHEDNGHITASKMRRELVDPLVTNQKLTGFFQHCHSGNSLELPYLCKKPDDLENVNFTRSQFSKIEGRYGPPYVTCFGASNLKLSAYHDNTMSFVTKEFIHNMEHGRPSNQCATILDVFNAMEDGDRRGKPEFSTSYKVIGSAEFLETW